MLQLTAEEIGLLAAMEAGDEGYFIPSWCPLKNSDVSISLDASLYN